MTVFGAIVTGKQVRDAAMTTVKTWSPTYLAELARRNGRTNLPSFRSYIATLDLDRFAEDQIPSCVIVAPGLAAPPEQHARGYRTRWALGIGTVVSGQDRDNTLELAELYAAAVRSLMLQHASLGNFAAGVTWVDERYDELDSNDMRTIAAGIVQLHIDVDDTIQPGAGPSAPMSPPTAVPADWPVATKVLVDTTRRR